LPYLPMLAHRRHRIYDWTTLRTFLNVRDKEKGRREKRFITPTWQL
jgi:hypothetical protein